MRELWQVAVDAPLRESLTYFSDTTLSRGQKVYVPLGTRNVSGVVIGPNKSPSTDFSFELKGVSNLASEYPALLPEQLDWLEWISNYYMHPLGAVVHLSYPPLPKDPPRKTKKQVTLIPSFSPEQPLVANSEQEAVIKSITAALGSFSSHLIFGVTGSGKTEVYLQIINSVLTSGKNALVLVPEISLTPQLVNRFAKRFGNLISILHSQLTDREKTDQWWDIVSGKKRVLIGARSALFCPIPNLGIIIVDEEHEPSFKQDEKLKYHGRDCAVMLAKFRNCPVVLGSATPSLESWNNVQSGKYQVHTLERRVSNIQLPEIEVVDMRESKLEKSDGKLPFWISPLLMKRMEETLNDKKQVALFLNRRGMAQMVICPGCGHSLECPNCDIHLTLHGKSHMVCHYCDYHENLKKVCPDCHQCEIKPVGLGTELVESELQRLFPDKRVARADRDEITSRKDLESLISKMESGEIDILVGTQMIAKGLDFPHLKLVGLVLADVGFNLPDFRATERSFQLITQMSGRSGRKISQGESPGRVVIQTYNPQHDSITFAINNNFRGFAAHELEIRQALNYPPIGRLASLRVQGPRLASVEATCRLIKTRSQQILEKYKSFENIQILGPTQAPLAKLNGKFRYHALFKGNSSSLLNQFLHALLGDQQWVVPGTRLLVDIDPLHLL